MSFPNSNQTASKPYSTPFNLVGILEEADKKIEDQDIKDRIARIALKSAFQENPAQYYSKWEETKKATCEAGDDRAMEFLKEYFKLD